MTHPRKQLIPVLLVSLLAMLAVAAIFGPMLGSRRAEYQTRAELFAWGEAALLQQIAEKLEAARLLEAENPANTQRPAELRAEAEKLARLGAWHVQLEQKYVWAAKNPWAPLPPDPAPPE